MSLKVRATGGARVARANPSPFVMVRIKIRSLRRLNTGRNLRRRSTFADASTPLISRPATALTAPFDARKRILRAFLPLTPLLLLVLTACADLLDAGPKEPCPRLSILRDAAQVTYFLEGAGRDLRDVRYQARFGTVASECKVDQGKVVTRTAIEIVAARGPVASEITGGFAFFVALIDPAERILAKEVFTSPFEFDRDQRRSGIVEQIQQRFTLRSGERANQYGILIGFQLSREQLEYNRKNRGR